MSNWYGWAPLGGQLAGGRPIAAQNADGRLEVFAESAGAAGPELSHVWQTSPNGPWSSWVSLGAPTSMQFLGGSAVARNADGRLEAFARVGLMSTGALWHIWQTAPNGGWGGWDNLGGGIGPHVVAVGQNQDGRLEVFAANTIGALQHIWQTSPGGAWSAWGDLGAPAAGVSLTQSLAVGTNQDGRLEVFGVATDGALWHLWQTAPNNGWSGWDRIGAPSGVNLGEIAVGPNQDGRLEVFAIGSNALWHVWQTAPNGGWSGWGSLGTPTGATWLAGPAVGQNADGRLEAFLLSQNDAVWHIWQTAPNGGWSGWGSLGGQPGNGPAVGQNADGRLELFVEDAASSGPHGAWHRWQMVPNGGWSTVDPGWIASGPAEAISALALGPSGDLLAAGASGVWRSPDHGASWTKVSATLLGGSMSAAPSGGAVWAVSHDGHQVLESTDDGATWNARYSTSSPGHVNSVLADPNVPSTIWVGMSATDTLAQALRSTDDGATWTALLPVSLRGGGGIGSTNAGPMAAGPSVANLVLAGAQYYHGGGVLKTADGGATWTLAYPDTYSPLAGASALAVGGASVASARIYAGLNVMQAGSLVRSDNGGATWTDLSASLPIRGTAGGVVANVALDPAYPDAVFISMWDTGSPPRTGVFASADGGHTWTEVGHLGRRVSGANGLLRDGATRMLYAATDQGVYVYSLAP